MRKWLLPLLALMLMTACARAEDRTSLIIRRAGGGEAVFNVERAVSPDAREKGLMFREHLAPDDGMIFIYGRPDRIRFWMKNTLIPLDMVFFNGQGVVTYIYPSARPKDLTPIGPDRADTCAVLEIGGGQAAAHGLKTGDRLVFEGPSACLP